MISRGKPQNKEFFILVSNEVSNYLHQHGFHPSYITDEGIYYLKTKRIQECIKAFEE